MKVKRMVLAALLAFLAALGAYPGEGQNKNAPSNEARLVPAIILPPDYAPSSISEEKWNAAANTRVYLMYYGLIKEIRFDKNTGYEYAMNIDRYIITNVKIIGPGRYSVGSSDGKTMIWKEYYLDANRFLQPK